MLTTAQQQALKAHVQADPVLSLIAPSADNAYAIADALNADAPGPFIVWRSSVLQDEIMQNGFDWVQVDNLSVGKARIWEWLFSNEARTFNPSKANVRAGIDEYWKGTAAMLAVRDAVYAHCKRAASVAEKVLATGTGTTVSPALMAFEGRLTHTDVMLFMGW